ncbi:hypothetical protein N6H14_27925 [Paenibacillus sp. CC-CFT747]|nr:hypothetical protein N6H14_27925 [Paenibacillus sp. CC-CFT747]
MSAGFLVTMIPYAPLLIVSNLLTTMGMFYFSTIWNTRQFAIISVSTPVEQARIFIWRECFLNVSRMVLLLLVLGLQVKDFQGAGFFLLLFLALFCAATIPYFSKMGTDSFEKEKGETVPV